jgi:Fe-S cluster assembly iron-binding protein IscA
MMITVTDAAKKELDAYFAGNTPSSIRVFLAPGG